MDWILLWYNVCLVLAWAVVIVFLFSGIDDLIYDVGLYFWSLYKRFKYGKFPRLTLEKLHSQPQQRIAVFIPAWNEGEVVRDMIKNLIDTIDYSNYVIFVGTYLNDPKTINAVDSISRKYSQIIKVTNPNPGPTTKADCLNYIYHEMLNYEKGIKSNFDIVVMHDAEDVVHPYSFLLYNYLLPKFDAIQLPILPLPTPHHKIVHWTYADEFAEIHMKDLIVRERIRGLVPFAGVGMGFSREKFFLLGEENIFNVSTLTEDYNFAKKYKDMNLKTIFVNVKLADVKSSRLKPLAYHQGFISNWAYFPQTFRRAVKQKTRWILGISLQEWELSGWKGNFFVKLSLIKDRKVFLSTIAAFLGYIVVIYTIVAELGIRGIIEINLIPIIYRGTLLFDLVIIVTIIMLIRILERFVLVSRIYGLIAGFFSIPRIIFANILNGIAAFRALYQYLLIHLASRPVVWDKTEHTEGVGKIPSIKGESEAKDLTLFQSVLINKIISRYDNALKLDPKNKIIWNNKGYLLRLQGFLKEAIVCYDKALEIDPNYIITWCNKGFALGMQGKYSEAIEAYEKALELDPNYAIAWGNKGFALGMQENYYLALSFIKKAISLDPNVKELWQNKGWILHEIGRYEEAEDAFEKARALSRNNTNSIELAISKKEQ